MFKTLTSLSCLSAMSLPLLAASTLPTDHIAPQIQIAVTPYNVLQSTPVKIMGINSPKRIADEYIVTFKAGTKTATLDRIRLEINQLAADKGTLNVGSNSGFKKQLGVRSLPLIGGFAGFIPKSKLEQLSRHPQVKSIEANRVVALDATTTSSATIDAWGADRLDQASLPLNGTYSPHGDGSGVHAYVIDTGIRITHDQFGGRAAWDFTASDITDGNDDGNGHGTHMAGTVGSVAWGVAPGVNLHSVKVLDGAGNGSLAGLIEGIQYVTNHHQSPAVAVIGISTSFSQAVNDAVAASIAAGVSYAVPGGDVFDDACQYSPASVAGALTAATTDSSDVVSVAVNHGECIDLFAPGLSIKSAWHLFDYGNNTIDHSPVAAAHVAGAAALMRGNQPTCTPAQIHNKLVGNARPNLLASMPNNTPNLLLAVPTTADNSGCEVVPVEGPVATSNYCKNILDNGLSTGSGVYTIGVSGSEVQAYCNMSLQGGGWTLVDTRKHYALTTHTSTTALVDPVVQENHHIGAALWQAIKAGSTEFMVTDGDPANWVIWDIAQLNTANCQALVDDLSLAPIFMSEPICGFKDVHYTYLSYPTPHSQFFTSMTMYHLDFLPKARAGRYGTTGTTKKFYYSPANIRIFVR